jgi:hypothetical protein
MRKVIAVAMVAGLVLGAASAVSAQDWSIGFGGVFNSNFGGGFKGDKVSSNVYDTLITRVMPKYVSTKVVVRNETKLGQKLITDETTGATIILDTILAAWDTMTLIESGGVGTITESKKAIKRAVADRKEMFTPHYGGGGEVFFSSKYAEATVGLSYVGGTWKRPVIGQNAAEPTYIITRTVTDTVKYLIVEGADNNITKTTTDSTHWERDARVKSRDVSMNSEWQMDVCAFNVNLGLWLKYPYELTDAAKVFPVMGIEYEIFTIVTSELSRMLDANNFSRTWFKAGIGGEFDVSDRIYIHPLVLYGIGWKNSLERDIIEEAGAWGEPKISHGVTARIGIGYRFGFD